MKITAIKAWQVDLPRNFVEVFDSTVVAIETDEGLTGYAECCPLGSAYLPSYARGVRAGLSELAPHLIGQDPLNLGAIIDIACWDLLGKATGFPVYTLLGGAAQDDVALYRAISQESAEQMAAKIEGYAAEGYTKFQLKVGADANEDIERIHATRAVLKPSDLLIADANTGWTRHEAARVVNAVADLDVYIEQPCMTYDECVSIRRRTALPFVLDEVIDGTDTLVRAIAEDAMDVINLKISKVGGLTRARLMRDLCVNAGIPMTIEDTWGGDITTAAIAHLARSTPQDFCFSATDFNSYGTVTIVTIAQGAPQRVNGRMTASDRPGLGIEPDFEVLGEAVLEVT